MPKKSADQHLRRHAGHADRYGEADRQRGQQHQAVEDDLAPDPPGLPDAAVELRPGDQRAGERHRADHRADQRDAQVDGAVGLAAQQLHGGDGAGGAAAHAVVERDHLRHVGQGHGLAAAPGPADADGERDQDQRQVHREVRLRGGADAEHVEEAGERRQQHAVAGHPDARAGGHRRRHPLQAVDEQERGQEIGGLNDPGRIHGRVLSVSRGRWT